MSLWTRIERRLSDLAGEILPDEYRQEMTAARALLDGGRAAEAAEVIEGVLAARADHAGAMCLLGAARLELGQVEDARAAFARALSVRVDMPEALLGHAQTALALGHTDEAIAGFRAAGGAAGGDRGVLALAYRGLGMAYRRAGDIEKAVRELRKAVAENTDDMLARAVLGEALVTDPRVSAEEARHHLRAVVDAPPPPDRQMPDDAAAVVIGCLTLGRVALEDEDAESAHGFFARALAALERGDGDATGAAAAAVRALLPGRAPGQQPGHIDGGRERTGDEARARHVEALAGLGDAAMLAGNVDAARQHYLRALTLAPRDARVHARLGDVHRSAGDTGAALARYEQALAIAPDPALLRRALDTALEAGDAEVAVRLAGDMLAIDPYDARAMVARGLGMARQGEHEAARATFRAALEVGDEIEAHLALARLELDAETGRGAGALAATEALAALRIAPSNARARALLAEARARELELEPGRHAEAAGRGDDAGAMYLLAGRLQRLALARSELADLAGDAARAAADFDQPLLVTVMGEFSSGKSTFVNAFIGHDVAPTGITPTTATINIVKYGREPGGRIVNRDGTIETLGWDELFAALRDLDAARVRGIDVVEILLPLPQLERVNIVDTPGLNSILPEHEEVARGFIARADAVVWLFTASQAGKASERKALESIHAEGTRVLGVLNKMDQLTEAEVGQLVGYVQSELGGLVEMVVPVAARHALDERRAAAGEAAAHAGGDAAATDAGDGNWPALEAALEERFFTQARQLKRDACGRRLAAVIERARVILAPMQQRATDASAALHGGASALAEACPAFIDDVVIRERAALQDAVTALYRRAAREVLELVRPRQLPFGSHSATPADRDYLIGLLDSGYEEALDRCRRAVVQVMHGHSNTAVAAIAGVAPVLGSNAVSDVARTAGDAVRLLEAQVFDPARAYLRGYVRGGYVANFFRHEVPRLELAEDAVYDALLHGSPDLDREIAVRLATAGTAAISVLAGRLSHWADVAGVMAYDLEVGVERALTAIEQERLRLTGQ